MFKNKILIFLTLIFFSNNITAFGLENKILVKIENQIITSLDVNNEYKYLIALNPNLKSSKKEDILKLSKRSIIQEKIKFHFLEFVMVCKWQLLNLQEIN